MPNQPTASGKLRSLKDRANKAEERYLKTNAVAQIEAALDLWQRILSHPEFAQAPLDFKRRVWNGAGVSHSYCYGAQGRIEDLDKALELWKMALKSATSISDRAMYLNNLGNGLRDRYARTGDLADLTKALECGQQAVDLTPANSPAKAGYLNNLGGGLRARYDRTGDLADLTKALECGQQAVALTPANSPAKAGYLNSLGAGLGNLYARTGDLADLTKALECLKQAVDLTPDNAPAKARYLNSLGTGLRARYERMGDLADLTKALEYWQQAVDLTPDNSPAKAMYLSNLGAGLSDRYYRTGEPADLTKYLECYQQAVALTPDNSPAKAMYLSNLGNGLSDRYYRTGEPADLTKALEYWQQAVNLTPANLPAKVSYLNNLGGGFRDRYLRTGDLADLTKSLECSQQAVDLTPANAPAKAKYLNNLGLGLRDLYVRTSDLADLTKSLECSQQAVDLTPANLPDKAMFLNTLGHVLIARYDRTGELTDLTKALECWQQAVDLTPANLPAKAVILNNFGKGLSERYARTDDLADLTKSLECKQQAVDLTPANLPDKACYLINLGYGLRDRYLRTGDLADLTKSLECSQQAVDLTPANLPDKARHLNILGNGLRDRYAHTGDLADLAQAQACFEQALQSSSFDTFPQEYCHAAFKLGQLHYQAGQVAEAHATLVKAHQAVEHLRTGTQSEAVRRKTSADTVELYRLLVVCCLELAEFSQGFEYAAAGKGRAFVDLLANTPEDFQTLLRRDPKLAQAAQPYLMLRQQILELSLPDTEEPQPMSVPLSAEAEAERVKQQAAKLNQLGQLRNELSTQWEALSQAYPLLTSTESAPALNLADAQALAQGLGATLVEYYEHDKGWVAFVITPTTFNYVPLEKLTEEQLNKMQGWLERVRYYTLSMEGSLHHWYEAIFAPLAQYIPAHAPIILAPHGILSRLPLAVAKNKAKKKYLAEEYTLAFAPSLSALWVVYQQVKQDEQKDKRQQPQATSRILTVAYPGADPADPYYLDNVVSEAEAIADLFPHAEVKKLHEDAAKTSKVIAEAKGRTLIHIGCHGDFKPSNPEASGLILADGPLTVRDIVRDLRLEETQLVTLSACQSGQSSSSSANEGTGLIQAMLTAGTPVVIASLWKVDDESTKVLFGEFYQRLHTGQPPAIALREAAQKVRDTEWKYPFYWGAFQANGLALTTQEEARRLPFQKPGEGTFVTTKINVRTKQGGQPLEATEEQQKVVDDARWLLGQLDDDEEGIVELLKERGQGKLLLEQFDQLVAEVEKVSDDSSLFQLASNIQKMVEEIPVLRERLLPSGAVRKVREYNLTVIAETNQAAPIAEYVAKRKPEIENDLKARRERFKALLEGEAK